METFLAQDLDVRRLNDICMYLWLAGRPACARPLSHQLALGRTIVVTEHADLHLVWSTSTLFLKPLPAYLFRHESIESHKPVLSLLISYVWLVRHQSDFAIAKKAGLLPLSMEWKEWTEICVQQQGNLQRFGLLEPRYRYGELRLARLNWIYILTRRSSLRGYSFGENRVGNFFVRHFSWLAGTFAYISILLSAMQVGLGANVLKNSHSFQNVSVGFTMFALVSASLAAVTFFTLFMIILISNVSWAYNNNMKVLRARGSLDPDHTECNKGGGKFTLPA